MNFKNLMIQLNRVAENMHANGKEDEYLPVTILLPNDTCTIVDLVVNVIKEDETNEEYVGISFFSSEEEEEEERTLEEVMADMARLMGMTSVELQEAIERGKLTESLSS